MRDAQGARVQPPEARREKWKGRIRDSLARLAELNEADGAIDATCVELAALHNAFSHKHLAMRQMRGRMDLDIYDRRETDA